MAHKVSPQLQLQLANRTVKHAKDVLRFLRVYPQYGTPRSRFRVQRDHLWLLRFGRAQQSEARARMHPLVDSCLNTILGREGGYNPHATNPVTGAYGGPQALPGSKMSSAGTDWRDNIWTQIRWMVGYVNGRYGGSCAALAAWDRQGWY